MRPLSPQGIIVTITQNAEEHKTESREFAALCNLLRLGRNMLTLEQSLWCGIYVNSARACLSASE